MFEPNDAVHRTFFMVPCSIFVDRGQNSVRIWIWVRVSHTEKQCPSGRRTRRNSCEKWHGKWLW